MTALAIALAVLGAFGYALGARLQHGAVRETIGNRGLRSHNMLQLVRGRRWWAGLVALGSGAALHACALGLAPLSVVQPIGVLALPIAVVLKNRQQATPIRALSPKVIFAVLACTGGVAAFVLLAAGSATPTPVGPAEQLRATQLVAAAVVVLVAVGVATRGTLRCVVFAAGCAVAYGYVSVLVRGVLQHLGEADFIERNLLPLAGIAVAMLVGGWLLQYGYASGPPDLVVACLTVIDPMVALGLGIGLLGEAEHVGGWVAAGEICCAALACVGVFALARHQPDATKPADSPAHDRLAQLTAPNSTNRSDRSVS